MNECQLKFSSQILGNKRNIWIQKPEAVSERLLVILDAELYRERVGAPRMISDLIKEEKIEPTLVVYVSYYSTEARWIECPCYPPFAEFISTELYPWLLSEYPELKQVKERTIAGLSYTGLAASYVAIKSEGLFQKVISQSGSYWSNDCWLSKQIENTDQPIAAAFYLDVGNQETETKVEHKEDVFQEISQISAIERFRNALASRGINTEYKVFEGGHSFEAWAKTLPTALQWALGPTRTNHTVL